MGHCCAVKSFSLNDDKSQKVITLGVGAGSMFKGVETTNGPALGAQEN